MSDNKQPPDRNLALELMRVTEAGALAAARAIGRGDPNLADRFAVSVRLVEYRELRAIGGVRDGVQFGNQLVPLLFPGHTGARITCSFLILRHGLQHHVVRPPVLVPPRVFIVQV